MASITNANMKVRDIWVMIPFTSAGGSPASFREAFLPAFDNDECRELTGLRVDVNDVADWASFAFDPVPSQILTFSEMGDTQLEAGLVHYGSASQIEAEKYLTDYLEQTSSNQYAFIAEVHPPKGELSAAELVATVDPPDAIDFQVQMSWPRAFRSEEEFNHLATIYPVLQGSHSNVSPNGMVVATLRQPSVLISACSAEVRHRLQAIFSKALYIILIDGKDNGVISIKLKASEPKLETGSWTVEFKPESPPEFQVLGSSMIDNMRGFWPGFIPFPPFEDWPPKK
jgi:hypothetical protein